MSEKKLVRISGNATILFQQKNKFLRKISPIHFISNTFNIEILISYSKNKRIF